MTITFQIRGDYITLDALLKATGISSSGAQAKMMIAAAEVFVDGNLETRKTRKLRGGEKVEVQDLVIILQSSKTEE